ncbi:MAG: hypothetical protein HYX37_04225 [Rhizobiales bacterium]|nr:hypothetical protein [Hyphomicrobiales bacterium]
MPSYQDVDWSYHNDAPLTTSPLRLVELNRILAQIGYQMQRVDPFKPEYFITWEKPSAIPIMMAKPQFRAADLYDELVYDRDDIVDMFLHFNGRGFPGGHEIIAKLIED